MSDRPDLRITLMSGPQDGRTYAFSPPGDGGTLTVTIGRREGCDIVLGYDAQVSRLHVRLIYDPRDTEFYLEDSNSRNGTFLGHSRIKGRVGIEPGVLFKVGRTWMRIDPLDDPPGPFPTKQLSEDDSDLDAPPDPPEDS